MAFISHSELYDDKDKNRVSTRDKRANYIIRLDAPKDHHQLPTNFIFVSQFGTEKR